ncbi:hypothetical protein QYM36_007074 [Artemia franciscana]|uniref:Diuretic hormone receptor n=1 Tax=Artemia franciscana TaxID=6661 RepID=A0AA88LCX1_ARTSF|nr:hypothetical protein QYM36_007074 [Artemia franciscana]
MESLNETGLTDDLLEQLKRHAEFDILSGDDVTFLDFLNCYYRFKDEPYPELAEGPHCNRTFDKVQCWPTTPAGTISVLPCVKELRGVTYDSSKNSTRLCLEDGTWANYSDYSECNIVQNEQFEFASRIYYIGYSVSIIALVVALVVFLHFKELRCVRNRIHTNLLITYVMADLTWIITAVHQALVGHSSFDCVAEIFLQYFHMTNFFWMFVEGLYLYMLVVETFSADKLRLFTYSVIGWGFPLLIVVVWSIAKVQNQEVDIDESEEIEHWYHVCPWIITHAFDPYDWIYIAPVLFALFANVCFLLAIMWVLITKLRSTTTIETQQYRKASKALLILIPLLGLTYILVITGPEEGILGTIHFHTMVILVSTQGFTVSLFYCFLNSEVRTTIHHRLERWHMKRSISRRRSSQARSLNSMKEDNLETSSGYITHST